MKEVKKNRKSVLVWLLLVGTILGFLASLIFWSYFHANKRQEVPTASNDLSRLSVATGTIRLGEEKDAEIATLRKELETQKSLALAEKKRADVCKEKRRKAIAKWKARAGKKQKKPATSKQASIAIVVKTQLPKAFVVDVVEGKSTNTSDSFYQENPELLMGLE